MIKKNLRWRKKIGIEFARIAAEEAKIAEDKDIEKERIQSIQRWPRRVGELDWLKLKVIRKRN